VQIFNSNLRDDKKSVLFEQDRAVSRRLCAQGRVLRLLFGGTFGPMIMAGLGGSITE